MPKPRTLALTRTTASQWQQLVTRSLSTTTRRRVDDEAACVIVGGGPVGLALASALASSESITSSQGRLTLVEASNLHTQSQWQPTNKHTFSNRVSSITQDNIQFLDRIGVWQHMIHSRTRPIEEMQVWDGLSDARITFSSPTVTADPFASSNSFSRHDSVVIKPMATLVENINLQRACLTMLNQEQHKHNVELISDTRVLSIEPDDNGWPIVELGKPGNTDPSQSRFLRARLLIGADGANSPVKSYSNIETFGWPYNAQGIVASMQVSQLGHGQGMSTAWQRFLPEGPIAFLPMSDTTASLVWSTTPALASAFKQLPLDLFAKLVTAAFSIPYQHLRQFLDVLENNAIKQDQQEQLSNEELTSMLTSIVSNSQPAYDPSNVPDELPPSISSIQPGSIASFPLRLSHTSSYIGLPKQGKDLRTCLIGDAAHTIHPLAGQGLNMGLGDVRALLNSLEHAVDEGGDIGSYNALRSYPRSRYIANHTILSTCDHLNSLYSTTLKPIVWARSTGLEILNEFDSLKNLIIGQAGGNVVSGRGMNQNQFETKFSNFNHNHLGRGSNGMWSVVGDGIHVVRSGVKMVKNVGSLVGMQLRDRMNRTSSQR
ncbi:putative ubiquinone biosynthesis monooxygenase [Microbotryomycetes sp. JL221]|nr:putative ubiquinone biosynthesis monooxygenase [Microbotryomycetes sp. JL221]